jgi:hypothetical protein
MKGHLRLVRSEPPARKKPERPPSLFTAEEQRLLRASLKTARGLFGSWACLADAMHVSDRLDVVANGRAPVSATVAIRLSKALGVPLSTLITPGLRLVPFPKVCPTCGRGQP